MLLINRAQKKPRSQPQMEAGCVTAPHGDRLPLDVVSSSVRRRNGSIKPSSAEQTKPVHATQLTLG